MKELSIEEKAKRYDEAIERAKEICNYPSFPVFIRADVVYPELKESEDVKMQKWIIGILKALDKNSRIHINLNPEMLPLAISWLEKQGEQKLTDKVEQKFKVDDWVINTITNEVEQVIELTDCEYICSGHLIVSFNNQHLLRRWTIQDAKNGDVLVTDDMIVLFKKKLENDSILTYFNYDTIDNECESGCQLYYVNIYPATKEQRDTLMKAMADAGYTFDFEKKELKKIEQKPADKVEPKFKVGDWVMLDRPVLITKVEDMPYNTHQYWTSDGKWFGDATEAKLWTIKDAKDGDLLADNYGIYIFDRFDEYDESCYFCRGAYQYSQKVYEDERMLCSVEVHPATKEQRDLLFQKMHEAGYEWDAEKKELKKIEQNLTLNEIQAKQITPEESLGVDSATYNKIVDECIYGNAEQKPAWSEEDENRFKNLIELVKQSDEGQVTKIGFIGFINMLKSLKDRYTWKPTEEQIEALKYVINLMASSESPKENDYYYNVFKDLREQLKKLMEG